MRDSVRKRATTRRLELRHGVVVHCRVGTRLCLEPNVGGRRESIGDRSLRGGFGLVGGYDGGAALAERLYELSRQCTQAAELANDHP